MERALPDTKERVVGEMNRMYVGFGAGIKARVKVGWVAGGRLATAHHVDRALGVTGYEDAWLQFQEGETIVFSATPAGSVIKNAGTTQAALVESIDETGGGKLAITADAALVAAIADNDYIFAGDQAGVSSQNGGVDREVSGLLAGVDNGSILATYNNVARAGNRTFNSRVIDASGAPYSGSITETCSRSPTRSRARPRVRRSTRSSCRRMGRSATGSRCSPTRCSTIRATSRAARARSLDLARRPHAAVPHGAHDAAADRLRPHASTWRRFTLNKWEWVSRGGAIWNLVTDAIGRKDAYFAFGKMYEQLACIMPRRNFRIEGLTGSSLLGREPPPVQYVSSRTSIPARSRRPLLLAALREIDPTSWNSCYCRRGAGGSAAVSTTASAARRGDDHARRSSDGGVAACAAHASCSRSSICKASR
jgi:hypothetical protein